MSKQKHGSKNAGKREAQPPAPQPEDRAKAQLQGERSYGTAAPVTHGVYKDENAPHAEQDVSNSEHRHSGDDSDYPPAHRSYSRGPAGSDAALEQQLEHDKEHKEDDHSG